MALKTGRAYIKMGGKLLPSRDGATLKPGTVSRKPVIGATGVHGYVEKHLSPSVECTLTHGPDLSIKELEAFVDATVTFECDSGPVYVLRGAWCDPESIDLSVGEAEVKVTFQAVSCEEMSA
jgi:hypothetical protein